MTLDGPAGERLIGSGKDAHLPLTAANVEEAHARVRWNEVGVFLDDLSKERGTFLNGERFEASCAVGDGDRVWLGPPGDANSVRVRVQLPCHPRDHTEKAAPAVEQPEGEWGALDDDDGLIAPEPAAPAKPAGAAVTAPTARPTTPAARPATSRLRQRPPVSRALLLGAGAGVLAIAGFGLYSRSQAPAPVLSGLLPPKAETGQTIQISGSGFADKPEDNHVTIADKPAQVTAASETQLSVVVPQGLPADDKPRHRVRVEARGASSNTLFFSVYLGPKVNGFEPDVAMPGDVVRATGEHFAGEASVTVGGQRAEVSDVGESSLRFKVPQLSVAQGKTVPVAIQVGNTSSPLANLLIGKLPLALEVTPARGRPGDRVTVKGRGFDPAPGATRVSFGGEPALVVAASESELAVVVPAAGALAGPSDVNLAVRSGGSDSSTALSFALARVSTALFLPRFFPQPGPDPETVYVSTELGPFLRLHGKADAVSAAERGARVAAALNAAMESAARGSVTVELREKPEPAVALAGGAAPIVTAGAADGAVYPGSRPSARALARYWTALLQDYLALFAQRQRPFRVLELSPRGQALLEVYSAAERRAGVGSGVPPSVVENLTGSQSRALAEMALSVPGETQLTSGAAVAGRWDGTLQQTGEAVRAIQLRIRAAGSGLQGSLTTRAGAVSGELPLESASYQNDSLSFVVKLGAAPLRFSGKVEGRSVDGDVLGLDGKTVGRFSLRWVE